MARPAGGPHPGEGIDCFVPHEQFEQLQELTPKEVYRVDGEGLRAANVLVAWLDGPIVDDGTACEIGMFAQLMASGAEQYRGIVAVVTDLRLRRRRGIAVGDGMNLFVAGAIESAGQSAGRSTRRSTPSGPSLVPDAAPRGAVS